MKNNLSKVIKVGTKLDKTIVNLLKGGLEDQIMTSLKA
jgi:hypothetical protein